MILSSQPTIADICCYGEIAFARMSGADLGHWLHVTAWAARIEALRGWAAPLDLLKMADMEISP